MFSETAYNEYREQIYESPTLHKKPVTFKATVSHLNIDEKEHKYPYYPFNHFFSLHTFQLLSAIA